jgi:RimJ/RimL family protein N-acetyltransferase
MPALRFPDPPLADELVLLRPWTADDIPDKVMSFADQSVQRFSWPLVREYTEMDARGYFVEQEQARRRGDELNFAFADPADPTAVFGGGSVHAVDLAECRAAVGYWLAPDARGRGIATHATQLMAGWAFAGLGLARLELTCGPDNEASQRVALRCGFVREGLLRSHTRFKGGRRDTVIFSLLPGEPRGANPA